MITQQTELLLTHALAVIDEAVGMCRYARMAPLFSGGHDSYCACFVAAQHRKFDGNVYHINTGIGSKATRDFVEQVCRDEGWKLNVLKSKNTFEQIIRFSGFPGPGAHKWMYLRLKDKCIDQITKKGRKHHKTLLVTGCRSQESARRMGHVQKIKVGDGVLDKKGRVRRGHRIWVNPCHDWSSGDQIDFMDYNQLARNPIKLSPLAMSGECFCGSFARPDELDMIRKFAPDVAVEIDRLQLIAREQNHPPHEAQQQMKAVHLGP